MKMSLRGLLSLKSVIRFFAVLGFTSMLPAFSGAAPAQDAPEFINSLGMKLVLIPAGQFLMGSPADEKERDVKEPPQRKVVIPRPFYMGVSEVTQDQYKAVMGTEPSFFKGSGDLPVEMVVWNGTQEFVKKLSEKEGKIYRLPTSAEWEYACRAGTTTAYFFGDDKTKLGEYAWYGANAGEKTHPVMQKKPNPWGLYDMYGNVWEWCQDLYTEGPADPKSHEKRVLRGGSWHPWSGQPVCRSAYIYVHSVTDLHKYHGFRVISETAEP